MSIFRRKTKTKIEPEPETKAYGWATASPVLLDTLRLWDGTLASYGTVYRRLAPVRTVVDFISAGVSTTPLKVYRREENGRPEERDHPLAVLLRNPNPNLTSKRLIARTTADLAVYGNAYWRKTRIRNSRFLTPLPPFRVTPKGGDLLQAAVYEFWGWDGQPPEIIPADEVVHFRFYDPEDPRIGSSKLESLRTVLLEEVEASRHRQGFWTNNAAVASTLETPDRLSDEAYTRLRTQFDNEYVGSVNSGKTAILEEGLHLNAYGSSAKEAEFVAGRIFVLEATARVYNVPLPVLSLTATATYASQEQFRKAIYQDLLPEWFETIQSEIELQLLPDFSDTEDLYVEFEVEAKLRGDFVDQAKVMNDAVGRPHMTVREARQRLNLEDRGEPTDDDLVVPVGPNYALESLASPAAPLAPVTEMPRAASALWAFFNRQERAVLPRIGAKSPNAFDRERWDRELAELVGPEEAQRINLETQLDLSASTDPHEAFERARARALGG